MKNEDKNICMQFYITTKQKAELDKLAELNEIKNTDFLQEMIEIMNGRKKAKRPKKAFRSRLEDHRAKIIEYRELGLSIADINRLINVNLEKKIGYYSMRKFIVSNKL